MGDLIYVDHNDTPVGLSVKEAATGVGCINLDNDYDTTYAIYLQDVSEQELKLIDAAHHSHLVKEYFDNFTNLNIDWSRITDDIIGTIIQDYFNGCITNIKDYYISE